MLGVRYEQVVADPLAVIDEIAGFAGLGPDPRWRDDLESLDYPNRDDGWGRNLGPDALATIERHQSTTLIEYGYDV